MCNCIDEINTLLEEKNAILTTNMFSTVKRALMDTCKIDKKKRGKPPFIFASFCPFCGKRYEGEVKNFDLKFCRVLFRGTHPR